jgi:hypothetical protein
MILKDEFAFESLNEKNYCLSRNYIYEYRLIKGHPELKKIMPLVNIKVKWGFSKGHYGF